MKKMVAAGSLGLLVACGGVDGSPGDRATQAPTAAAAAPAAGATGATGAAGATGARPSAYDGEGFVVHEWGTDTLVVGSDGSLQIGLHHEEEDLPPFVEDRMKAGARAGSVEVKMETPVTYFYSDRPRTVQARVRFPRGVFTQWFPRVEAMSPKLLRVGPESAPLIDPIFGGFEFQSDRCRALYGEATGGLLDWGTIEILPREATPSAVTRMPAAPLEKTTWGFARDVASNAVRTPRGDVEQFLFYRGLGSFEPPVKITAEAGGGVKLASSFGEAMGAVFVIDVAETGGAFREEPGVAARGELATRAPSVSAREPLAVYEQKLGERVARALEGVGLFHDEAAGMVNTWKRQWFRTPGTRVLYLLPQSWTDQSIPLEIVPAPDRSRRVMLMRVELITPEVEQADVALARALATEPAAVSAFLRMGRFGEPRLRRALSLLGQPAYGQAALATVARPGLLSVARE